MAIVARGPWLATTPVRGSIDDETHCCRLPLTLSQRRQPLRRPTRFRILAALSYPPLALFNPHRASCGCAHDADMLRPCCGCTLPFSRSLAALPTCAAYLHVPYAACVVARVPGRHSALRTAPGMGRMDRVGSYYYYCRERCGDLRHEANFGQSQGEKAKDCGERRDERSELLRESERRCDQHHQCRGITEG